MTAEGKLFLWSRWGGPAASAARRASRRRGSAAVLAMVFLVLLAVLALGFYEGTEVSSEVSHAEGRGSRTRMAITSGVQLMKYHLATLDIPNTVRGPQLFDTVFAQLGTKLNNYANMPAGGMTITKSADNTYIYVPGGTDQWIGTDADGSAFRAVIKKIGYGDDLEVTVYGRFGKPVPGARTRGVKLLYRSSPYDRSIFRYGMASRGPIGLSNGYVKGVPDGMWGSVLSTSSAATPVTMSGSAEISGEVYLTNPTGTVSGGVIAGVPSPGYASHVHPGTAAPEFPVLDPSPFIDYLAAQGETLVTGNISGGMWDNIRIKANANTNISAGAYVRGVVLIEAPNNVTINGGATVEGVIVVANPDVSPGGLLTLAGNATLKGPENLPVSFGAVRTMTGSAILVPNMDLKMTGGTSTIGGGIVAKSATVSGKAGGDIRGSVILTGGTGTSLAGIDITGQATFNITYDPAQQKSAGLRLRSKYLPQPKTYAEVSID